MNKMFSGSWAWRAIEAGVSWWSTRSGWERASAPFLLMALLWWSSSRSPTPGPASDWRAFLHNGAHVIAYAGLAASVWLWGWCRQATRSRKAGVIAVVVAGAYGMVDELHQGHVPGRVASVSDWLTDCCGALLACSWLRWRIGGEVECASRVPWLLVVALLCVAFATWGPW